MSDLELDIDDMLSMAASQQHIPQVEEKKKPQSRGQASLQRRAASKADEYRDKKAGG